MSSRTSNSVDEQDRPVVRYSVRVARSISVELERFAWFLEKTPNFFIVCFSLVYAAGALGGAFHKKLWLDEIISAYIVSLPTFRDIWTALLNTVDGNPPLYYLMARPFLSVCGSDLAIRLPAVIGFWIAALAVFSFIRKYTSALAGSIATLVFATSGAFRWASEGRPYAPVLGLTGLLILLWRRCAESPGHRRLSLVGMTLLISALASTHYYSILILGPLFFAEVVRSFVMRRVDWSVGISLGIGSFAILLWTPLIQSLRGNVAGNAASADYFAEPNLTNLYVAFETLVDPIILPGVVCLAVIGLFLAFSSEDFRNSINPPAHETAMIIGLALFPFFGFAVAKYATHTFSARYILPGALGLGMLAGLLVHAVRTRLRSGAVLIFLTLYSYMNFNLLPLAFTREEPYDDIVQLLSNGDTKGPVVVSEGFVFVPLWYYANKSLRDRLFYLTDMETARRTTDTTNENIMLRLASLAPGAIINLDEFISSYKIFCLYYRGASPNSSLDALVDRHCHVTLLRKSGSNLLFQCDCGQR